MVTDKPECFYCDKAHLNGVRVLVTDEAGAHVAKSVCQKCAAKNHFDLPRPDPKPVLVPHASAVGVRRWMSEDELAAAKAAPHVPASRVRRPGSV